MSKIKKKPCQSIYENSMINKSCIFLPLYVVMSGLYAGYSSSVVAGIFVWGHMLVVTIC